MWKNLKGDATEEFKSRFVEGVSTQIEVISASDAYSLWNTLASIIKDAANDTLTARRESWWLCEEVQYKVKEKQASKERSKKKVVAQAKEKAYEDLYKKMDSKEGANNIFRIAKARERRRMDLGDLCVIKDERADLEDASRQRNIKVIKDMYDGVKTRVRTIIGNMKFFPIEVGLHQELIISPYLFALILDELSRGIQEDIPWCLIFADDIAVVSKSAKVEIAHNEEVDIRIGDKILQPKESFRYLGSMIHKSGRIDEDVSHRIKTAWLKWKAATRFLCDRNIHLKLKGKFYRVAIRPPMLYGSECWPITKALANKMEVAELRMLM
ncbi:ataxia telangiectasia mutated family protein [Tanacetum coccineum]